MVTAEDLAQAQMDDDGGVVIYDRQTSHALYAVKVGYGYFRGVIEAQVLAWAGRCMLWLDDSQGCQHHVDPASYGWFFILDGPDEAVAALRASGYTFEDRRQSVRKEARCLS